MKVAFISVRASSLSGFKGPLIRALIERGAQVLAMAPDYDELSRSAVQGLGAKPIDIVLSRTGTNPFADMRDTYRLIRVLRSVSPDVVFCYFIKPVIFGTIAAWLSGVPRRIAMIEGLGFIFTDNGKRVSIRERFLRTIVSGLYRFALRMAHDIIFLNPDDIRDFDRWRILAKERAMEIGGIGLDLDEWPCSIPPTDVVRFLFVGRLLVEKGIYDFINAARCVRKLYPEAEFIVLGGLDTNPGVISEQQIQAWVDEGLICWPGHVAVQPWLRRCSVFVLPSYREGLPRSTQEAMASGRAVITTDVPGCRQTVEDGLNGYLVPVRDSAALADAMIRFLDNRELILLMGKESRRLAEERFSVHKVNSRLFEILSL